MRRPKVIYDSQAFDMQVFGGISRYFCEIARRLSIAHDFAVRFSENYYIRQWHLGRHRLWLPGFLRKRLRASYKDRNRRFAEKILASRKDFLFHPTYYDPYFLDHIGDRPFVVTVHDMIHELFPQFFRDASEMSLQKREVITRATRIIAISENTKRDVVRLLGIDPARIDVIYHSTSMTPAGGGPTLNLPTRYVLFVGDRAPYKNFPRFLKAFARICRDDESLKLVCTGAAFNEQECVQLEELGITARTQRIRATDQQLAELYARAELFVFPSLYEGFGIPILEAYACGCPVVLSRASCFPEIAGEAGEYFDPESEEQMAQAMQRVLHDPARRAALITAGHERLQHYSWDQSVRQTEQTYLKAFGIIPQSTV